MMKTLTTLIFFIFMSAAFGQTFDQKIKRIDTTVKSTIGGEFKRDDLRERLPRRVIFTETQIPVCGWYDNTLKNIIGDFVLENTWINWIVKNRVGSPMTVSLYSFTKIVTRSTFPAFVERARAAGIYFIVPYTADSEIDALLAYNKRQTNPLRKVMGAITEFEPYNHDPNNDGIRTILEAHAGDSIFIRLLEHNTKRLHAEKLVSGVYMGWHMDSLYKYIVKNVDFVLVTCYRPAAKMESAVDAFRYMSGKTDDETSDWTKYGRLTKFGLVCESQLKGLKFGFLQSCETVFGMSYFSIVVSNHAWVDYYNSFMGEWNKSASLRMKRWLIPSGTVTFVTRDGQIAKP